MNLNHAPEVNPEIGLKTLGFALSTIQSMCIGVFRHRLSNKWALVIKETEIGLTCITIGDLFGMSIDYHIPKEKGRYIKFPKNKSLWDMMSDPPKFLEWWEINVDKRTEDIVDTAELTIIK